MKNDTRIFEKDCRFLNYHLLLGVALYGLADDAKDEKLICARKIWKRFTKSYCERMNVKIYHVAILAGLVFGLALDCYSVGFESRASRRMEIPRLRRVSSTTKSNSSTGDYSDSGSVKMPVPSRNSRRSVADSDTFSLLADGFGSEEGMRPKVSSSSSKQKVLTADGLAMVMKDAVKVEYGEGCGETTDEALKEAMKDVLQKVVGVYVDSDFRMNNDKIIKDEIITHSNGFIDHYKKMEEDDDPNGRGKVVTIKAWVKMRDFVNRMKKKIAPSERINVDGVLIDADLENDISAEALLRKEIENIDPANLLEVRLLESRPKIVSVDEDIVTMRYLYIVRYSDEFYYKEFLPRIKAVFNQIAINKDMNETLDFSVAKVNMFPRTIDEHSTWWKDCPQTAHIYVGHLPLWDGKRAKKTVAIMDRITKGGVAMLTRWTLLGRHMNVFCDSMQRFVSKQMGQRFVFSLFDENNNVVSKVVIPVDRHTLFGEREFCEKESIVPDFMRLFKGRWSWACRMDGKVVSLYESGVGDSIFFDRFIGYVDVKVAKADVKKIKSAEIKLETTNKGEVE